MSGGISIIMTKTTVVLNLPQELERGLAELVQTACCFDSKIHLSYGSKRVNAKSIMGVLSLQVPEGDTINIVANGKDEKEAIAALEKLASTGSIPSEIL